MTHVKKLSKQPAKLSPTKPRSRLSAEQLGQLVRIERQDRQQAQSKAYRTHAAQTSATTVQMSVRMNEDVYRRVRALCKLKRRTNGEMLHDLIEVYLDGG